MKQSFRLVKIVLILLIISSGCKKDKDETPTPDSTLSDITISSSSQFKGTIDDTSYTYVESSNIEAGVSSDKLLNPSGTSTAIYHTYLYVKSGDGAFEIDKGTLSFTNNSIATNAAFKSFFEVGTYPYSSNAASGIEIYWSDKSGTEWYTSYGTDQSGSSFKITDIEERTIGTTYSIKIRAIFTCKLYNKKGQSKVLTNGVYVGYFQNM